jgi:hypothetical protein
MHQKPWFDPSDIFPSSIAPLAKNVAKYNAPQPYVPSAASGRIANRFSGYHAKCPHTHAACRIVKL